jgi:hypothetical protein
MNKEEKIIRVMPTAKEVIDESYKIGMYHDVKLQEAFNKGIDFTIRHLLTTYIPTHKEEIKTNSAQTSVKLSTNEDKIKFAIELMLSHKDVNETSESVLQLKEVLKSLSVPQPLKPLSDEEIKAKMPNSVLDEKFFGAIWLRDYMQSHHYNLDILPVELFEQVLENCTFMDNGDLHEKIKSYLNSKISYKNKLSEAISVISEIEKIFDKREYYQDSKEFQVWQICNDFLGAISLPVDNTPKAKIQLPNGEVSKPEFMKAVDNTVSETEVLKIHNCEPSIVKMTANAYSDMLIKEDELQKQITSLTSQLSLYKEQTLTKLADQIRLKLGLFCAYTVDEVREMFKKTLNTIENEKCDL